MFYKISVCFFFLVIGAKCSCFTLSPERLHEIKQHIDARFAESYVDVNPSPNIVITNILPSELYVSLLENWPSVSAFPSKALRKRISVTFKDPKELSMLASSQKELWVPFGETVVNKYIKEKLVEAFLPFLPYKFPDADLEQLEYIYNHIELLNNGFDALNQDIPGYAIGPHVDPVVTFIAFLIYLPLDDKHSDRGTCLYKAKDRELISSDVAFLQRRQCTTAKRLPFLPNTLVAFLQTPLSWHGVERSKDSEYIRKTYHCLISLSNKCLKEFYGLNTSKENELEEGVPNKYIYPERG